MPSPLTVHCPACRAALKLRNREYVGKRVACPKCRKPFVVADPGDADDDFSALDDFDSYEDAADDDEGYERPTARRSAPRPASRGKAGGAGRGSARSGKPAGKGRKPARKQRSNLPFIIGGAVVGLAVLVGLGFLVAGMLGKSTTNTASIQEFSYLPSDSEALVKMRLADVMNSPWQQQLMNPQQQQTMNALKARTGIDILQIESISVGISGLNPSALSNQGMGGPMGALMNPSLKFVVLVRSRTAFPEERIRNSSKTLSHNGETYYMDTSSGGLTIAVYLPDDRTMVVGREVDVKRAIDQGATPPAIPQFGFADLNQHVGVAFVPSDRSFLQNLDVPEVPGFPAVKKAGDTLKSVVGGAFSLNYGADAVDVQINVKFGTDADAAQLKAAIEELIPQGKQMMGVFAGSDDPQMAKAITVANQIFNTLNVSQTGDLVSARLSLSLQATLDLQALRNQGF